jgi:hypothetical protein
MELAKPRFVLVIPYLALTAITFYLSCCVSDSTPGLFDIGLSDLLLLLLTSPWIFFLPSALDAGGFGSGMAGSAGLALCVVLNAAILYYVGLKFERAPDSLV